MHWDYRWECHKSLDHRLGPRRSWNRRNTTSCQQRPCQGDKFLVKSHLHHAYKLSKFHFFFLVNIQLQPTTMPGNDFEIRRERVPSSRLPLNKTLAAPILFWKQSQVQWPKGQATKSFPGPSTRSSVTIATRKLARAKGITNDALPVIMSASDWASFMISCTVHQVKYQRKWGKGSEQRVGVTFNAGEQFKRWAICSTPGQCEDTLQKIRGSGVYMCNQ